MKSKTKSFVTGGLIRHGENKTASIRYFYLYPQFDVDSYTTQTEAKLQVREELVSLSKSVVSQTFTELGEILKVLV